MSWTDGVDKATGFLVDASTWNSYLGSAGSLMMLKSHAHGGATGAGATSLGPLVLEDFTDAAAPAAPGAGKTRLYSTSGQMRIRAGAAGADSLLALDPTSATGDLIYRGSGGALTTLAVGANGSLLGVTSGLPAWTTGVDEDLVKKWALIG